MAVTAPPLWLPLGQTGGGASARSPGDRLNDRGYHAYSVIGRLADGLTPASAAPGLEVLSRAQERAYPAENRNQSMKSIPCRGLGISGSPSDTDFVAVLMTFVLGTATALLLVVALNLANMLLARGDLRGREIAIRLAVGASRWSVVRQLLVEASLLSAAGGLLGLGVAHGATRLLVSTLLPVLPMFDIVFDPAPDFRVLVATFAFAAFGTVVFGLGPALRLSRADLVSALKVHAGTIRDRSGLGQILTRDGSVVAQIALSLTLLTAGGLFLVGVMRVDTAEPGYSLDRGLIASVDGFLAGYDDARTRAGPSLAPPASHPERRRVGQSRLNGSLRRAFGGTGGPGSGRGGNDRERRRSLPRDWCRLLPDARRARLAWPGIHHLRGE